MKILIIFNHQPYDGTDLNWNGLRLAVKLLEAGQEVRIFLMNDAVDMARDACRPPEEYDQDLSKMLKNLISSGVKVKGLAIEEECMREMLVIIEWKERTIALPLSQLGPIDVDEETQVAINDWHYWVKQGYRF